MTGTRENALLMVELAKWGAMIGLPEALRKVYADDFDREAADSRAWDRVGPAAKRSREKAGVPEMYENFEALAEGQS